MVFTLYYSYFIQFTGIRNQNNEGNNQESSAEVWSSEGSNEDSQKLNRKAGISAGTTVFMDNDESEEEYHDVDKTDAKNSSYDLAQTGKPGMVFIF